MKRPRVTRKKIPSLQEYAIHAVLGAVFPEDHMRVMALKILTRHYKPVLHEGMNKVTQEANTIAQIIGTQGHVMEHQLPASVVCETCHAENEMEYDIHPYTTDHAVFLEERHWKRIKNSAIRLHTNVLKLKGAL